MSKRVQHWSEELVVGNTCRWCLVPHIFPGLVERCYGPSFHKLTVWRHAALCFLCTMSPAPSLRTVVLRNFMDVVFNAKRHCVLMLYAPGRNGRLWAAAMNFFAELPILNGFWRAQKQQDPYMMIIYDLWSFNIIQIIKSETEVNPQKSPNHQNWNPKIRQITTTEAQNIGNIDSNGFWDRFWKWLTYGIDHCHSLSFGTSTELASLQPISKLDWGWPISRHPISVSNYSPIITHQYTSETHLPSPITIIQTMTHHLVGGFRHFVGWLVD